MVDNASSDDSVRFVSENYPWVEVVKSEKNSGFAAGNNIGLKHCSGEFVALINNDMVADRHWIESLVSSFSSEQEVDIVGPKMLFYRPFLTLHFKMKTFVPGHGDSRDLGVMLSSSARIESSGYDKIFFQGNTYGEEESNGLKFHWISNEGVVKVPYEPDLDVYLLRFQAAVSEVQKRERIRIYLNDGTEIFSQAVGSAFKQYEVAISADAILKNGKFVINNASSEFSIHTGYGKDIGMGEDDNGQFDELVLVKALCGGSMLFRKTILEGGDIFDGYFFAYYEDTDFCWRMSVRGRKLLYNPSAIVYHIHTGTSKEWSPFFYYHTDRNRLAMLIKNGDAADIFREVFSFFGLILKDGRNGRSLFFLRIKVAADLCIHVPYLIMRRISIIKNI